MSAVRYMESQGYAFGGPMSDAMALMGSPAIILAILLANQLRNKAALKSGSNTPNNPTPGGETIHVSLTDAAQLLVLAAMLAGLLMGEAGKAAM